MRKLYLFAVTAFSVAALVAPARADYETHPALRPAVRCNGAPNPGNPSIESDPIPPSYGLKAALRAAGEKIVFDTGAPRLKEGDFAFRRAANDFIDDLGTPAEILSADQSRRAMSDADVDLPSPIDPGGVESLNCQRLFWDMPAPNRLGLEVIATPFEQDRVPRFPNGLADRLPPLYIFDPDGDGIGGDCKAAFDPVYAQNPDCDDDIPDGFESDGPGRAPICPDHMVPWWAPVLPDADNDGNPDGQEPVKKSFTELDDPFLPLLYDPTRPDGKTANDWQTGASGEFLSAVGNAASEQTGEVFRLECRRGSRTTLGPWQLGTDPRVYDRLPEGSVRFESTARMDDDVAQGRLCEGSGPNDTCTCTATPASASDLPLGGPLCAGKAEGETVPATGRREWNVASDFYNHFASHHGTCWNPETGLDAGLAGTTGGSFTCNDPDDPWAASDVRRYHAAGEFTDQHGNRYDKGECYAYQHQADGPDDPDGAGTCYAGDADPSCNNNLSEGQMFRNATQYPGRLYVEIPEGRGVISLEDQLWDCEHHVVAQLPAGSYSMTRTANYRMQKGGLLNPLSTKVHGANPGQPIGGTVGEKIIQYFTEPLTDPNVKPVNVEFEVIQDLATTWYPPFTWHAHTFVWHAPFDLAIGLITTHSHHRTVASFVDVLPVNPIRSASNDANCGGSGGGESPEHVYSNLDWEDARVCEYWKHADGPLILRKGQAMRTTCYVNHGVTPEAIKHGLVAGSTIEGLRAQGVPIPPDPKTVPTSTWAPLLVNSPLGRDFLYGTHPPENYRAAYKCSSFPHFTPVFPLANAPVCDPNPQYDADGDYVDGPYLNEDQCGAGGWCNPAPIIFANVGEDEMCIPVFMYWRLDNLLKDPTQGEIGVNDEPFQALQEGRIDEVGTPGVIQKSPGDIGDCRECSAIGW